MNVDNVHALFEPDLEAIRAHLERLFGRARDLYPGGLHEIAYTDRHGVPNLAQLFDITPEGLDRAADFAVSVNKIGRNVYVGANPRKPGTHFGRRASAGDVEWAIFNFADVDKPAGIPKLRQAPLPYTWAVTTGRKPHRRVHPYWERQEPTTDMSEWSAMQAALRDAFAGDNITNPDRIMRLGGSVSYPLTSKKQRDGHQVEKTSLRTVYDGDERDPVSIDTLRAVYQQQAETREAEATGPQQDRPNEPNWGNKKSIKDRLAAIIAGDHWHDNTRDLVAQMVNRGDPDALILALAPTLTLHGFTVAQTHADLSRMLISARVKWAIPNNDDDEEDFAAYTAAGRLPLPLEWFRDITVSLDASDFVEGLLCSTGLSVVYGESNCGKTFFMTDLAFHIATGRPWRGKQVEQGGVIYVALEGGFGIRNRLAALRLHHSTGDTDIPLGIVPCSINLLDPGADTEPLITLIKEAAIRIGMPIALIVIDTLSRAINGGNENAPEDMGKLISSADRIREQTGAHVSFVHHSGKDQARGARGHSSLRAATDTEIEITKQEGDEHSRAIVTKQRELEIAGEFCFELKQISLGTNKRGKPVTSCVVVDVVVSEPSARHEKLTDHEYSFMKEIRDLMNHDEVIERVVPEPGMPVLKTLRRDVLRDWLVKRGKLAVSETVRVDVRVLPNAERQRLFAVLNTLRNKGFIEMNAIRIWLLK